MEISFITERDFPALRRLFADYYTELDCEDDPFSLFDDCILPDLKARLLSVAVARGDELCGFVIFQIDDVINDWCFAEGKGDVREICVSPAHRKKGVGRALLDFAENALKKEGAKAVYLLPTDESEKFFVACGYADAGDYCAELDCKVFDKKL